MILRVRLSRRHRKVALYVFFSILVTGGCGAFLLMLEKDAPAPVIPGASVDGLTDVLARNIPASAPRIVFKDATAEAGVDFHHRAASRLRALPEDMGSGCALEDLDGDGDLDLFFANFEPLDPSRKLPGARRGHALFINDGKGRFEERSEAAGVATPAHGMGIAAGDYDGDGDIDLFVSCYGPDQLFRNRGDASFEEVAAAAGVAHPGFGAGAAFADYDLDGDLDLYVGSYVQYRHEPKLVGKVASQYGRAIPFTLNPSSYRPGANLLYRNRGDGTFEDVSKAAKVENLTGRSLAVAFTDLDGDRLPDIYVANDVSDNAYFRNAGGGAFEDVSYQTCTADYRGAMGLGVGDFDGDLDLDIFITHWIAQENALYEFFPPEGKKHPTYADVADMWGLGAISLDFVGWGTFFFDYDADGRQDIFAANGNTFERLENPQELQPQRLLLFWNDTPRGFFDTAAVAGGDFLRLGNYRGAVSGDIDGDGDLDIVVTENGGKARIFRNEGEKKNHWLRVAMRERSGNRFAHGARVVVWAGGKAQVAQTGAQPSYLSALPLDLHFGLGPHETAEKVIVRFPDGTEKTLAGVRADQRILVEK